MRMRAGGVESMQTSAPESETESERLAALSRLLLRQ